jgi:uncharacterized protein (TIGR03083 family)
MAGMDVAAHIDALTDEGTRLAAAADGAGLHAPVPTCPGWTVRDLVRHTGGVHRWATAIVAGGRTEPWNVELEEVVGSWPADAELTAWFHQGHAALVSALRGASPDLECWTFLRAPSPLAMWARRQAHETTVHRVDVELAGGGPVHMRAAAPAADGIDELLTCFITRRTVRDPDEPCRTLTVRCTDAADDAGNGEDERAGDGSGPGSWRVTIGSQGFRTEVEPGSQGEDDCTVSGPAWPLFLALWHRRSTVGLHVAGDGAVLETFLDRVHVNWS